MKTKLSVVFIFQARPIWLLSLEPKTTMLICMEGFDWFSELAQDLTSNHLDVMLYDSIVCFICKSSFRFSSPPNNTLYFVSGNVIVLNKNASQLRDKIFTFYTNKHQNHHKLPPPFIPLHRLKRQAIGSTSNF